MASISQRADEVRGCAFRCQSTCRFGNVGWGCKFVNFALPDGALSKLDKKRIFNNVYEFCRKYGILDCPNFAENRIDEVLDSVR